MDSKIGLVALVAVLAGAVTGGIVTANFVPEAKTPDTASVSTAAIDDALKEAAEARAEAIHWQNEADRLARELASKREAPPSATAPIEQVDDVTELVPNSPSPLDASLKADLAELEEYRARDREREERFSDRRGDMAEWQNEMINRRTNMFTELIERTNDPAEQQRWADIEKQMTVAQDLFRQMRNAETDEQRDEVRNALGATFEATQSMLKEQQNSVLQRALNAQGITDADQISLIQGAVQSSLSDQSFQMSNPGGPGRGWGGGPGRGGPGPGGGRPGGGERSR